MSLADLEALQDLIFHLSIPSSNSALFLPFLLFSGTTAFTFVLGEVTLNFSQLDRLWTFLPPAYAGIFYYWSTRPENGIVVETQRRLLYILLLQGVWSARLTFKAWKRGFFSLKGETEDYRWLVLKRDLVSNRFLLFLFNLTIVSIFQNVLLAFTSLPSYYLIYTNSSNVLSEIDTYYIPALYLLNVALETIADANQQSYQSWKASLSASARVIENRECGFCTHGLYRYSRHPNFFHEQAGWYILFLYTYGANPKLFPNPSFYGPLSMTALFFGSTMFTEWISARKYPNYKLYKERIAMFDYFTTCWKEALWYIIDHVNWVKTNETLGWGPNAQFRKKALESHKEKNE